ncbi:PAM68 family protein [Prochlorothrix hollandica]|uniref:DUF3464 family protein n=1 Tax=Prochlorothrix hollandica PCC 9006 = CALU 1027 TaxID=317619 RepID=A0A0M2PXI8_PROHO|nr:PAM68 family protein [Prochlorothrix hollandica]KKI99101.1 hypothetical protein PROH_15070 [Prochlorothrix hollandica PCC 9006 = CALU 1027]
MAQDQSQSKSEADSSDRLPFEPKTNRKKDGKTAPSKPNPEPAKGENSRKKEKGKSKKSEENKIPEVVSKRMLRRIAVFSGLPTALGIITFILSYFVVTQDFLELPNSVVVVGSLGFFGLGTLGISYGVLSASWEEETEGSLIGLTEFQLNLKRFIDSWRTFRQQSRAKRSPED